MEPDTKNTQILLKVLYHSELLEQTIYEVVVDGTVVHVRSDTDSLYAGLGKGGRDVVLRWDSKILYGSADIESAVMIAAMAAVRSDSGAGFDF